MYLPAVILAQQNIHQAFQIHHSFIPTRIGIRGERNHDTFAAMRSTNPFDGK